MSLTSPVASSLVVVGLEHERIIAILQRHLAARGDVEVRRASAQDTGDGLSLTLQLVPELGAESFHLTITPREVMLRAGDELGLLQGIGKFLRRCHFTPQGIQLGEEEIVESHTVPALRGIYFATHFHNYYHDAPLDEIIHYVEDLALWGMNTLQVWFDMHHYTGIDDPAAQAMIERLRSILLVAKNLGVRTCLVHLGNEAYAGSPTDLRADFNTGRASYDVELCPNKPGATELMLQWFDEMLQAFAEISPDYITFGPYDQGGCACEQCKPWGANGYLQIAEAKARHARTLFPNTKIILSTWLFDYARDEGEWTGLTQAFSSKPDWCDYIQADSHTTYPDYPLVHGVPGGLPLVNFPEISMWMMHPWGGFGANPLAARFEKLLRRIETKISGGFTYSEGIYEDINKVLWLQWYGNPQKSAQEILREYIAYEFSPDVVDDVLEVMTVLEKNHNHLWTMNWHLQRQTRFAMRFAQDPRPAFEKMQRADALLSESAKKSWRWRILYLRALLDSRLYATEGFWGDEVCESAFEELTAIFHAQNAEYKCAPPTKESIAKANSSEHSVTE